VLEWETQVRSGCPHGDAGPPDAVKGMDDMASVHGEIRVATTSYEGTHEVGENLARHHRIIDEAADGGASLVVFPEISLHGYPNISDFGSKRLGDTFLSAERVPDGPSVRSLAEHAADREIHVVYGLNEAGERGGEIYNSAVLTGPEGHIGVYRKVHVHPVESISWLAGADFPVFDTAIGRIGIMICYDKWFPESARELMLRGAEIIAAPAAWGGNNTDPEATLIGHTWCVYDEVRALENCCWVVSSNYARLGDRPFIAMSRIVAPTGECVATTGPAAGLATASINVRDGIAGATARLFGPRIPRDRRPDLYRAAQRLPGS
jgi:predicted amidohydrolase